MYEFHWFDYVAAVAALGMVFVYCILLIYNGYDDHRRGRNTSTWRKPHD